jgi:hypothetical protein
MAVLLLEHYILSDGTIKGGYVGAGPHEWILASRPVFIIQLFLEV